VLLCAPWWVARQGFGGTSSRTRSVVGFARACVLSSPTIPGSPPPGTSDHLPPEGALPVPTDLGVTEALAADLASTSGFDAIPFDVRIVNGSSPVFLGRLLRQGSLVFERDREARIEWEAMAMSLWLDFRPVWERMRRQALRSWARG
jgi:hypothetical protein